MRAAQCALLRRIPEVLKSCTERLRMKKLFYKTIILSDIHLGTNDCKISEVNEFLRRTRCEKLVLNGDIIAGSRLGRGAEWSREHTRFVRLILKKVEKYDTELICLRGDEDQWLSRFIPFAFDRICLREDYVLETAGGRYLVLHGDLFDAPARRWPLLGRLGAGGRRWPLMLNQMRSRWQQRRGFGGWFLGQGIKAGREADKEYMARFEEQMIEFAAQRGCVGVICGHTRTPADDRRGGGLHYLNAGDWVESLTAVVEHLDGRLEVLAYSEFCERWSDLEEEPTDLRPPRFRIDLIDS